MPPLPAALQVEVTSACNLRCAMCLVRYRPPVNKLAGALPLDLYRRLVDEVPPLRRLTLQGLGEPLLSPYLLDMVRLAKRRGIVVGRRGAVDRGGPGGHRGGVRAGPGGGRQVRAGAAAAAPVEYARRPVHLAVGRRLRHERGDRPAVLHGDGRRPDRARRPQ
jgi:hypothetical protein